jgi:G3E family GTPase
VPVPAHLVLGAPAAGKTRLVQALLAQRPTGERWAVLQAERGRSVLDVRAPDVVVREADAGCLCCAAVTLRVELTRLLRAARPDRLLVEASGLEHAARTVRLFGDFWVARAVSLASVLLVLDATTVEAQSAGAARDAVGLADVVVLRGDADAIAGAAAAIAPLRKAGSTLTAFDAVHDDACRLCATPVASLNPGA